MPETEFPNPPASTRKPSTIKRICVALMGTTVLLIGIALIILPGPAFLVIPAGLAILATEFIWARRALAKCRKLTDQVRHKSWFRRFWRGRVKRENAPSASRAADSEV